MSARAFFTHNNPGTTFTVYAPGTVVVIYPHGDPFSGTVIDVSIGIGGHVMYNVTWWSGRERTTGWVHDFEVKPVNDGAKTIGFAFQDGEIRT
jgi:hypothetical protein